MRLIHHDGFWFMYIPFVRMVKLKFQAQFSVDHLPPLSCVVYTLFFFFLLIRFILLLCNESFRLYHHCITYTDYFLFAFYLFFFFLLLHIWSLWRLLLLLLLLLLSRMSFLNHIIEYKLQASDRNNWNYITVYKQIVVVVEVSVFVFAVVVVVFVVAMVMVVVVIVVWILKYL